MPTITVTGQIQTVVNEKYNYIKLWETYDFKGEARHRLWTAWLDTDLNLNEGDTIEITGDLSTKVGTYNKPGEDTKSVVEHALNNCNVKVTKMATTKAAAEPDPIDMPF